MFREITTNQLDMLLCDMVHSHLKTGEGLESYDADQYGFLSTFPKKYKVDIGCFIVRTAALQLTACVLADPAL
jgi:hypothetical protein